MYVCVCVRARVRAGFSRGLACVYVYVCMYVCVCVCARVPASAEGLLVRACASRACLCRGLACVEGLLVSRACLSCLCRGLACEGVCFCGGGQTWSRKYLRVDAAVAPLHGGGDLEISAAAVRAGGGFG